jgi:hypothetical protein
LLTWTNWDGSLKQCCSLSDFSDNIFTVIPPIAKELRITIIKSKFCTVLCYMRASPPKITLCEMLQCLPNEHSVCFCFLDFSDTFFLSGLLLLVYSNILLLIKVDNHYTSFSGYLFKFIKIKPNLSNF